MSVLIGPAGRPFTAEQSAAISARDGSLLLEANAGSGKTSVLVERFVRSVLDDGIRPPRILAITFTERAAGELRARVRERFVELNRRDEARETETAWVSTIHGFCARVLRAHAIAAGLDPAFEVLDEATARTLRDRAWDRALGELLDGDHGAAALDLVAAYDTDRLRRMIVAAHDRLRSAGHTFPRLPAPPPTADPRPLRAALAAAASSASGELALAGDGVRVVAARAKVDRCVELLRARLDGAGGCAVGDLSFGPAAKALRSDACTRYLGALDGYASACRDRVAAAAVALLDELLGRYATAYADVKRARAGVDFDDLELFARDLLEREPALRRSYAERFDRVMVDEFQDSNSRQFALFAALDRDDLFVVGDEQQSIYGFRNADVELFRAHRARLAPAGRVATLATNFRSRGQILDTLNAAFAPRLGPGFVALREGREPAAAPAPLVELLLTDQCGWDVDGEDAIDLGELPRGAAWRQAEARLLAQRLRELVDAGDAKPEDVVVLLRGLGDLPMFERALEDQGLLTLSVGGRGYWGRQVVRDLCAWLAALANPRDEAALYGVLASPLVGVSSDALAHVARAGRGNAWRAIERAFGVETGGGGEKGEGEGVPGERAGAGGREGVPGERAGASGGAGVPGEGEPAGVPDARGARLGRGDAVSPDAGAGRSAGGLAARLRDDDRERIAAFAGRFAGERALAPRLGLDELLRRVVDATGYDLHVLSLSGGPRRLANVHKLLRLAAAFERDNGRDVRGLADLATAELEAEARETDAPVELGDVKAVRLMSIHAAKGLEFGTVCVADLGRKRPSDDDDLLVDGDEIGLRIVGLDGTSEKALAYERLRDRARERSAREEERVLYVAATRARERLILSGGVTVASWPKEGPGAPPLSWLGPALVGGELSRLPTAQEPQRDVAWSDGEHAAWLRCALNSPATVGRVLREASLAPAGATLPVAPRRPPLPDEPPAPAPAPVVRTLSYSSLAAWGACGYRFYLRQVLRLPEEPVIRVAAASGAAGAASTLDPRVRGTLVHALLERPGRAEPDRVAEVAAAHGVALTDAEAADVARLTDAFEASPLAARVSRARKVHREHGFAVALGDTLLTGIVDVLAVERGGGRLVVDYKTDALDDDTDLAAFVDEHYGVQRRVYALAALRGGAARVEVAYAFLERPREPVATRFEAAGADALEAELLTLAAGMLAGEYPVTAHPHRELCESCPGRRALCSYPEELTLAELPRPDADARTHVRDALVDLPGRR
ncbi:MAG: ATP-dependent helicase/nuclease subunit [Solirubrobacteraceae bacterium]|nr:ATP-dependent helicase/nuclease subunit [Solirubrobacteraceae bacterium]